MPNRNYIRGRLVEYKAKKILHTQGYYAMRTAGSHSEFDIIAISAERTLLVQLKRIMHPAKTLRGWTSFKQKHEKMTKQIYEKLKQYIPKDAWVCLWVWIDSKGWYRVAYDGTTIYVTLDSRDYILKQLERQYKTVHETKK